ncbi:MAG: helix-turn-helix domain-containing protein [Mixta calida]|nr:helix-turn-helix domain-containing protein [Mixta calida]MDU4943355.1 helix-turn-helix domain-containing protein [Mixta calida]MDU5770634.1 helix-turn-helix domain-containing protein [Mixta calida]MDU5828513.1 helix-turn-helix domain-containing protein [Mixta calida]
MEEQVFTREEAAAFLRIDKGTVSEWIRSGRLAATQINPDKKKSPYLICKSDCIAALKNPIHNRAVNAVGMQEDKACQSNSVGVRGTATSLRLVASELDGLLKHRTKGRLRNSMTS